MKRKYWMMALSALLIVTMLVAPFSASAASGKKKVYILKVTEDGARIRKGPSSAYDVITSAKKGTIVFYMGKHKDAFCYICTSGGTVGYMYKGFLKSYGACYAYQVYYCKDRSAGVYTRNSSGKVKKVTTLSKHQFVVVYQAKGDWAYIKTLSGTGGFVKKSALAKA